MSTHGEAVEDIKKAKEVIDEADKKTLTYGELLGQPDPIKHKYISFVKSGFRILAGLALAVVGLDSGNHFIQGAGLLLVIAEVLGIAEELV